MTIAPEHESLTDFVEYLFDDDRTTFTHHDLGELAWALQKSRNVIRKELESYGLTLTVREPEKRVRGFTANPHDRWYGPGSSKSHGGSGHEQITGFAGQKG